MSNPAEAFYAFVNIKGTGLKSEEFAHQLLEKKHVGTVPGTGFGVSGEGFLPSSYATSTENIREGIRRIKEFVEELIEINMADEKERIFRRGKPRSSFLLQNSKEKEFRYTGGYEKNARWKYGNIFSDRRKYFIMDSGLYPESYSGIRFLRGSRIWEMRGFLDYSDSSASVFQEDEKSGGGVGGSAELDPFW